MKKLLVTLSVAALFALPTAGVLADDNLCGDLLKGGIYETSSSATKVKQLSVAIEYLCTSTARTVAEASAIGASVGIPDLGVVLGFNGQGQSFSDFKTQLCSSYYSNNQSSFDISQATTRIPDGAASIIAACSGKPGVRAYISKTFPPGNDFVVVADYLQAAGAPGRTKISIRSAGDKANCGAPIVTPHGSTKTFLCSLKDDSTTQALLAFDTDPSVGVIVPTLRYSKELPSLPERQAVSLPMVTGQVSTGTVLNMEHPGFVRIVASGRWRMNGTSGGPFSDLEVKLNGVQADVCKRRISGIDNAQEGDFQCEWAVYLPLGFVRVDASQSAYNGDPTFIRMTVSGFPMGQVNRAPRALNTDRAFLSVPVVR